MSASLRGWRIVLLLGWTEIAKRYRRSALDPFWLTLSMAGTIGSLSVVYSYLFGLSLEAYLPFLTVGFSSGVFSVNPSSTRQPHFRETGGSDFRFEFRGLRFRFNSCFAS